MNPLCKTICLVAACCSLSAIIVAAANNGQKQQQAAAAEAEVAKDVSEEMHLINKSLEGLLSELAVIKREATGRLSQSRNRVSTAPVDSERIRQTKVSKFVLKRVAELELESLGMRDEMTRLFELQKKTINGVNKGAEQRAPGVELKQEDHDFDDLPQQQQQQQAAPSTTTTAKQQPQGMPATTPKPEEEAANIGFDLEALKKLGEEIGKRLDQFGKDAAKNLNDLLEGVKLVFREPAKGGNKPSNSSTQTAPTTTI